MNQFIAFVLCALMATTLAAVNHEKLKQRLHAFRVASETCNADPATRVSDEDIIKLLKGGEKHASFATHALCVSKAVGWQNDDGSLKAETLRSRISEIYYDHAKVEEITKDCVQAQATPEATADFVGKCIFKQYVDAQYIHHH